MLQKVQETDKASVTISRDGDTLRIDGSGPWVAASILHIDEDMRSASAEKCRSIIVDTHGVTRMDTTGAWMIERLAQHARASGIGFEHCDDNPEHLGLVKAIGEEAQHEEPERAWSRPGLFETVGRGVFALWHDVVLGCNIIGAAIQGPQSSTGKSSDIRTVSIIHQMDHMGLRAVPVIALMSFLIGGIIAQQGAFQLRYYGAEIFVANLVGILHLREIGVLLTAIMVAGRSGSAITAEVGTMKMREEIDALTVMGLNPVGVLISPRLIALIIVMPMLTVIADLTGVMGAVLVSWLYVGLEPGLFLQTLRNGIDFSTFLSGIFKAPFMALIIGVVSAIEGTKVEGSAESLGQRTTSAVVKSIFVVIVVDGLFSIFYSAINY